MKSFSYQARWNLLISVTGQAVAVVIIALASRMLGAENFGYYIWIAALPGMVVVFDLYLGLSLQNRLTELIATGNHVARDNLIWGFIWGMYAVAISFIALCAIVGTAVTAGPWATVMTIPSWVIWLGLVQVSAASLGVPLLAAGVGFNAHREVHRGAGWSLAMDILSKTAFIGSLGLFHSLAVSIGIFAGVTLLANVALTMRFMHIYDVSYQKPSFERIRKVLQELRTHGNARDWAILRVADAFFKNSELVIGAFLLGAVTIGDFAVFDRLSNALMLAANSAYVVLVPALAWAGANGDTSRMSVLTKKVGRLSLAGLILFSVVFLAGGEWIASIWAGRTIDFPLLVVILVCARAWTRVLSALYWNILFGYKLVRGLLLATLVAGVAYAALYGALISQYGVLSILVSQILAQSIFIIMAVRMQQKYHLAANSEVMRPVGVALANDIGKQT